MATEITGFSNPRVKSVRALREKKGRRTSGRFLAEGLRILAEALDAGHVPLEIWHSAAMSGHALVQRIAMAVEAAGGETFLTSDHILAKMTGKDNPQAVIGVFQAFDTSITRLERQAAPVWLVAERLRDPGNLGTMLRTGDAVGAGGLVLVGDCADPFSVEAVRASMGALFTQRLAQTDWDAFLAWLRQGPGQLVGASLNTDLDYRDAEYAAPVFLLIGNESQGLPKVCEEACDLLVKIPMRGRADSLNAAVSAAVLAYRVADRLERGG